MKRISLFLELDNITIRLYDRLLLPGTNWRIYRREQWAVLGANGSGKSTLVKALAGKLPVVEGEVCRRHPLAQLNRVCYISFEAHKTLLRQEFKQEVMDEFAGKLGQPGTVCDFLFPSGTAGNSLAALLAELPQKARRWLALFGLVPLFSRPLKTLSTGEMRKVIICRGLLQAPGLLILDEPFDGLDVASRNRLSLLIDQCMRAGIQIILITHRYEELVKGITHILWIKEGRVEAAGARLQVLKQLRQHNRQTAVSFLLPAGYQALGVQPIGKKNACPGIPGTALIELKSVTVRYGSLCVFEKLNWCVRQGEHWLVTGANGAGKSTLLSLLTGDNPQAYQNEIYLFGRLRGSGESIWDIKEKIGFVSAEFQLNYWQDSSILNVMLSGFFDSIGLYKKASAEQVCLAREWLAAIGLDFKAQSTRITQLSFGEQRLVLIARAMLKVPQLLILDEPLQGLDATNRRRMIAFIEAIGQAGTTGLIYVTHYGQEVPDCITHTLHLHRNR